MKYIIVNVEGLEQAIVFSELITHKHVANAFFVNQVISAGFCSLIARQNSQSIFQEVNAPYVKVSCWGDSESLKLKSRGKIDEQIIKQSIEFRL